MHWYRMEQILRKKMTTVLSKGRTVQIPPGMMILNDKGTGWRFVSFSSYGAGHCLDWNIVVIDSNDTCFTIYLHNDIVGRRCVGNISFCTKIIGFAVDSLGSVGPCTVFGRIQIVLFGSENQPSGLAVSLVIVVVMVTVAIFHIAPLVRVGTSCIAAEVIIMSLVFYRTQLHFAGFGRKQVNMIIDFFQSALTDAFWTKQIAFLADRFNAVPICLTCGRKIIIFLSNSLPGFFHHGAILGVKVVKAVLVVTQSGSRAPVEDG